MSQDIKRQISKLENYVVFFSKMTKDYPDQKVYKESLVQMKTALNEHRARVK